MYIITHCNVKWTLRVLILKVRPRDNLGSKHLGTKIFNTCIAFRELLGIHQLMNKTFDTLMVRTLKGRRKVSSFLIFLSAFMSQVTQGKQSL